MANPADRLLDQQFHIEAVALALCSRAADRRRGSAGATVQPGQIFRASSLCLASLQTPSCTLLVGIPCYLRFLVYLLNCICCRIGERASRAPEQGSVAVHPLFPCNRSYLPPLLLSNGQNDPRYSSTHIEWQRFVAIRLCWCRK